MGVEWWVLMITFHPTLSYLPPLLSEGLGEAFSLPHYFPWVSDRWFGEELYPICLPPPSGRVGVGLTHPAYTAVRHNVLDNRVDTYIHRYNRGPSLVLSVHCEGGGEQGGCLSVALTLSLY